MNLDTSALGLALMVVIAWLGWMFGAGVTFMQKPCKPGPQFGAVPESSFKKCFLDVTGYIAPDVKSGLAKQTRIFVGIHRSFLSRNDAAASDWFQLKLLVSSS